MIELGIQIIVLVAVGVVCGIVNIFYNPEEYEYTDYRRDDSEGEQHGETR